MLYRSASGGLAGAGSRLPPLWRCIVLLGLQPIEHLGMVVHQLEVGGHVGRKDRPPHDGNRLQREEAGRRSTSAAGGRGRPRSAGVLPTHPIKLLRQQVAEDVALVVGKEAQEQVEVVVLKRACRENAADLVLDLLEETVRQARVTRVVADRA